MDEKKLTAALADFMQTVAIYLPNDVEAKLQSLIAQEPSGGVAQTIYDLMQRNQAVARELHRPCCQDTGAMQFFLRCGEHFPYLGKLEGILRQALLDATRKTPLRHNSVETFDEYNTKCNVGTGIPCIFWEIVPERDDCEVYAYMAGGGCTLPGAAKVLMPSAGYEGVVDFVLEQMVTYGLNACPPLLVGIGIGTSIDAAALMSKKALMRPIGSHSENQLAARLEQQLADGIDAIGIGPQGLGGAHSVMGVHIEHAARHPSVIAVALNVGCWSHRRGHAVIGSDGTVKCLSHAQKGASV